MGLSLHEKRTEGSTMNYEPLSSYDKKKIVQRCIREQFSMEKVSAMYGIPLFKIVDYITFFYKNTSEQVAMLPMHEYENLQKKLLPNIFTGYLTETTEAEKEKTFNPSDIESEGFSLFQDQRSFQERLNEAIPDLSFVKSSSPVLPRVAKPRLLPIKNKPKK
jgi:hypothetical protein